MEPGHEGREEANVTDWSDEQPLPQWSPAMKAGKSEPIAPSWAPRRGTPQWSPAMKAGKRRLASGVAGPRRRAAMEPGHEGREEMSP